MNDENEKALAVAIELLRKAVANMPAAMARNARRVDPDPADMVPDGRSGFTGQGLPTGYGGGQSPKGGGQSPKGGGPPATPIPGAANATVPVPPPPPPSSSGKPTYGPAGGGIFSMLAAQFKSVLGPMALFGQVMGSSSSGFRVLGTVVKYFAATIGSIILPVVFSLSVALLELTDTVWKKIKPVLTGLYQIIAHTILPVFRLLASVIGGIIGVVGDVVGALGDAASWVARQFTSTEEEKRENEKAMAEFAVTFGGFSKEEAEAHFVKNRTGTDIVEGALGEGGKAQLDALIAKFAGGDARDDVMKSLMMSMMPKAQTMGVSAAYSAAREKALNADPIEMKMLKVQMEQLAELKAANAKKPESAYAG